MKAWLAKLDERVKFRPLLLAWRESRPQNHVSPLKAPIFSLGRIVLILVFLLILSGLGLMFYYNPTAERAASSLAQLHEQAPLGWLIHNVHRWSALMLFTFVILHALRSWLKRAYRYPRDLNWWLGLSLMLLVIASGGTGYLLRWDIKAFALMDLVISNFSGMPVLGEFLVALILGGSELGVIPLFRGYATHVWFFPALIILLIWVHLLVVFRQGLVERPQLWPHLLDKVRLQTWIHFIPGMVLFIILLLLSIYTPHTELAGPEERSPWPHPDWLLMFYFLPFWFFKASWRIVGSLIIPLVVLIFLVLVPRIDPKRGKPVVLTGLALVGVVGVIWLFGQISYMGYQVPLEGCNACHRRTIVGGAPQNLSDFEIRDPDWLIFHMRQPLESIFEPFNPPE